MERLRIRRRVALAGCLAAAVLVSGRPTAASAQDFATDSAWLASKGFFHRAPGALLHADRDSIRRLDGNDVSDLLRAVAEIEIRQAASGERHARLHAEQTWRAEPADTGCMIAFYLNGGRMRQATGDADARAVDRAVRVRSLDGLEVHGPATSPIGEADVCGSVLLWSRSLARRVDEEFTGRLRGRALWIPGDAPAGGIEIALDPGPHRQRTDSGGWFEFGGLAPGVYQLSATSPSGATWSEALIIRAFAITQVEIEVERSPSEPAAR